MVGSGMSSDAGTVNGAVTSVNCVCLYHFLLTVVDTRPFQLSNTYICHSHTLVIIYVTGTVSIITAIAALQQPTI